VTGPYEHPLTVRYLEVDQQGVVFNSWYLAYFDDALTGFLEHRGLPYPDLIASGHDAQVVHTELDWTGGLRFGDPAVIAVDVAAVGTTSFTLTFAVNRDGVTLCRGRTVYVCVATDGSGKRPLTQRLRQVLDGEAPPAHRE
jgi:acyl-CoA thioester hydrolase